MEKSKLFKFLQMAIVWNLIQYHSWINTERDEFWKIENTFLSWLIFGFHIWFPISIYKIFDKTSDVSIYKYLKILENSESWNDKDCLQEIRKLLTKEINEKIENLRIMRNQDLAHWDEINLSFVENSDFKVKKWKVIKSDLVDLMKIQEKILNLIELNEMWWNTNWKNVLFKRLESDFNKIISSSN